ncbi:MAG: hypothetical protein F6K22_31130 [Okeania sp. SIO2F4]|uniref:hypothetical protein n=1 Tax=Okeania sp. SIO2F4 TaxID=2607790 RepID=UPI00142A9982|nr:hypothetical protein [Okeania sp. SIO2F4]NES06875.1 hypothetical protein [Okeania sp. SIO2F4]
MKDLTKTKIQDLVQNVIEAKLNKYSAETDYQPFFEALFGEAVIIQTLILHSFYTEKVREFWPPRQFRRGAEKRRGGFNRRGEGR